MSNIALYNPSAVVPNQVTDYLISVDTPQYNGVTYKVVNPDLTAVAGLPMKWWKVSAGNVVAMSSGEQATVDAALLPGIKRERKAYIQALADAYLNNSGYSPSVIHNLSAMYTDSNRIRPNRSGHLQPLINWMNQVNALVGAQQKAITDATSINAANSIGFDSSSLAASDPKVFIMDTVTVSDATPLSNFLDGNALVVDSVTGISGPFYLMQELVMRKDLYNDSTNPIYDSSHTPILGSNGILQDHANRVLNLENIHDKTGWHNQEVLSASYQRPQDMLIYYGWLNSFNSAVNAWTNEKVAQDMARYNLLVFGDGIQSPSHGDYANTQVIIPRVKALKPDALIFGYIAADQDITALRTKVDQWDTLQVHGIFMDQAGYDYGLTRAQFNTRVDYVHGKTYAKVCFINSWNTDHVLGTANDVSYPNSTYNPSLTASKLNGSDWILLESFGINTAAYSGYYEAAPEWAARGSKMGTLRNTYGVNFAGVGVLANDRTGSDGTALFNFAFTSALSWALEGFGTSDTNYASGSAAVKYWPRPSLSGMRSIWALSPSVQVDTADSSVYHRFIKNAHLYLKFTSGSQSSSITIY